MKFMRLGWKPDCFTTIGNITTSASELESDIVLDVDGHKFRLHLFPLLSKCGVLSRLVAEAAEAGKDEVRIEGFPGSAACFEVCARFCYGVLITVNAHNVGEVLCGAEFLNMSEMVEKGNLIYKLELFMKTSILRGWRDSVICLQSSKACLPWSENLKIVDCCVESVSSKVMLDPAKVEWSFSYTKAMATMDHISVSQITSPAVWNGLQGQRPCLFPVPNDWWVQDLCDLDLDLFWRVLVAVKAKGVANHLVGEALRVYTLRWLPEASELGPPPIKESATKQQQEYQQILETIVSLLPSEKGSASCSFLLKLLKAAISLNVTSLNLKPRLARRIGLQLEEASLADLLLPSLRDTEWYDVDTVIAIVEHFLLQIQSPPLSPRTWTESKPEKRRSLSADHIAFTETFCRSSTAVTHASKLKVAKLIDGYLAEIARDPNLSLGKFMQLADCIPDFARPLHDGLYRAVDMYLKEHPTLPKGDRKRVCKLLDCRKLSIEACMHAAQNDRLPLRTVVQVLFIEQVRTAATGGFLVSDMPSNIRALVGDSGDELSVSDVHTSRAPSMAGSLGASGWYPNESSAMNLGDMKKQSTSSRADRPLTNSAALRPPKPSGLFSKPRMFFQKLFSKKVSNFASSRGSETQSFSKPTFQSKASTARVR